MFFLESLYLIIIHGLDTVASLIESFRRELARGIIVLPSAIFLVIFVSTFFTDFSTRIVFLIGTV